jgi:hypothetical protein
MLTSLDQLKVNFAMVGDASQYAGSMNREFLAATAITQGATGLAKNALQALNITLGQFLLPTVQAVAGFVGRAAIAFRGWAKQYPTLAKAIMIFLAVGSGLLILLGGLTIAFAALTAAAAPLGIALLPLLGIAAAVIGGIALVAAAGYLIYANWGKIAAFFESLWGEIQDGFRGGIAGIAALLINFSPLGLLYRGMAALLGWLGIHVPARLTDAGAAMIQGLINGISRKYAELKSRIVGMASDIQNWFKSKLGIHSPSRVFAGLGAHVMAGLDQGLAAGAGGPLARIADISGQMTRALALGAGAGAIAVAAPATAAAGSAQSGPAVQHYVSYTINITAAGGNPQDIAEAVRMALEKIERERRGRSFGDD